MKKGESILKRVIVLIVVILIFNIGNYIYSNNFSNATLTGNVIDGIVASNDSITGNVIRTDIEEKKGNIAIFLLSFQWSLLFLVFIYAFFKRKQVKIDSQKLKKVMVPTKKGGQKTDLDTLYEYLKEKGQVKVIEVMKMFTIKKEIAMEWGKILESGDLAEIDYPMMRGPIIKYKKPKNEKSQENRKSMGMKHEKDITNKPVKKKVIPKNIIKKPIVKKSVQKKPIAKKSIQKKSNLIKKNNKTTKRNKRTKKNSKKEKSK